MNSLRRTLGALSLVLSLLAPHVSATSYSTDQSDLWYIPAESGWGMQLVQRNSTIFATLFVYDPAGNPIWYVATMNPIATSVWSGDLYATTGPWFGTVPFNPALVTATRVGTMSWDGSQIDSGVVTYSVNGVAVSKNVVRETLVLDDFSGTYVAAVHSTVSGCTNPANDLPPTDFPVSFTIVITQSGSSVTVVISALGMLGITITGTVSQSGQFGTVLGTYSDTTGEIGNASITTLNVQENSLTGLLRQDSTNMGCQSVSYFAGTRA